MKYIFEKVSELKGKSLLSMLDLNKDHINTIINLSYLLKELYYLGIKEVNYLKNKKIGLIFQKPSTRTRVSFTVAIQELGGVPYYFGWSELQLIRGETVKDTAKVLSKYLDGAILRVYEHEILNEFADNFGKPIINALSDLEHPCQILADFYTIYEKFGKLDNITVAYIGDGANNIANSLLLGCATMGININIVAPKKYQPLYEILNKSYEIAQKNNCKINVTENIEEGVKNADIIYTDVFVSMGMEKEKEERLSLLKPYQVNQKVLEIAKNAYFMHCGPWHLGEEVTPEVVYGERSLVFEQAENRLHVSKAILISLF
jgi:ornithine carbamoyltransferase